MDNKKIPKKWKNCPNIAARLLADKFLIFKTPLNGSFKLAEEVSFDVPSVLQYAKDNNIKIGLWIDLTYTYRYYDPEIVKKAGCTYRKLKVEGGGKAPSKKVVGDFTRLCVKYLRSDPGGVIGIHCTHGFNRTGFLVVSFLVMVDGWSVTEAIAEFSRVRPPGIYRENYIKELCNRFNGGIVNVPTPLLTVHSVP